MANTNKETGDSAGEPQKKADQENARELERVYKTFASEYPNLLDVFTLFRFNWKKDGSASNFTIFMTSMMKQLAGQSSYFKKDDYASSIRESLVEIYSCPYLFKTKRWEVRQSIEESSYNQPVVEDHELQAVERFIGDMLKMIGSLARQIHSCEMQRILRLIVAAKGRPCRGSNLPKGEARRLADEIIYCFEAILAEIKLLTAEERVKINYPKIPRRISLNSEPPRTLSTEEKSKWCRDQALRQFKSDNADLQLAMTFEGFDYDPVKSSEDEVLALAKSFGENRLSIDPEQGGFDYGTLGRILGSDFHLYYDMYVTSNGYDPSSEEAFECEDTVQEVETTDLQIAKERIIEVIRTILDDAIRMSAEKGSKAEELWKEAQIIFTRREGDFYSPTTEGDDAAETDLNTFLRLFREARQKLWADWVRANRKDIMTPAIRTAPEGKAMEALNATAKQAKVANQHTLYYASKGEMGLAPTDSRRKSFNRQQMTEHGATLVRDKGLTPGAAAKKMIQQYSGQEFVYTSNEEDNLTREITRYCQANGIRLPNSRT